MKQRLGYILKHNAVLQQVYKIVMSALFKFWGLFIPTNKNLVLFVSFMGKEFNDSPKILYDAIRANPKYSHLKLVWAFENPKQFPEVESVRIDSAAYFRAALSARYWVTNTNIERGLHFKKRSTIYLNTWHGSAIKTIGNDCPGRSDYNSNTLNALTVSSPYDERVFASAFNAREPIFLRCGNPRNEALWNASDAQKTAVRNQLQIPADKKIILYAPTWRESTDGGKSYGFSAPIDFAVWKQALGSNYIVLFRAHHQTDQVPGVEFNDFVRNLSDYPNVQDLLIAADVLVSDYSSLLFDYSILGRPLFVYAYDYETYKNSRGMYLDMKEVFGNCFFATEGALLHALQSFDPQTASAITESIRKRFIAYRNKPIDTCLEALLGS